VFDSLFVPEAVVEEVSDRAWLRAIVEVEAALARAEARAGVIPGSAADAIGRACAAIELDSGEIAVDARAVGNPAEPVVRALRAAVDEEAAPFVHWGATSQDIVDTAAMLVSRRSLASVAAGLDACAGACARLAGEHRSTVMAARTLLQQALPTTFGLKAATWLDGILDARAAVARVRPAAQLGGAAGTLASLGERGPEVARLFAEEVGLPEAPLPWHVNRSRVAELAAALALTAGATGKPALDVVLLAQTEVREVSEPGGGGSSTLPHKQNPTRSVLVLANARRVHALVAVLNQSLLAEHERAVGAWHAEWGPLTEALALAAGAASLAAEVLGGLEVHGDRMRANLDPAVLAERRRFQPDGDDDPAGYLGSADLFVRRALDRYQREVSA
jgi:3-carboxy-cis,cis-muconate cycloisomerase